MDYKLIQQFQKSLKNGKTEQFREHIIKNNLTNEFMQQCFAITFRKGYKPETKEYKEATDLSNFTLKLCEETFNQKFGTELANRFEKNIYETEQPSIKIFNIFMLMNSDIKINSEYESKEAIKLFDLASQQDKIIGTHIIGGDIGDKLSNEGISLTGHKFVANDYGNEIGSIKSRLEKNITFFDNDPIGFITHIIKSRGYNSPTSKFNDIMIVEIPQDEMDRNDKNLIIKRDLGIGLEDCLNPEYIKGFARVSVKEGNLEGIHSNPLFRVNASENREKAIEQLNIDEWKNKFEDWYEQSNTTKFEGLKVKVMNFLKGISKNKNNNILDRTQYR